MLIVEPRNGLANRLRVIDSGIELARKLKKQLVIDWILNKDLNCRFDALFEPLEGAILNDGIRLSFPFKNYLKLHFLYKSLRFNLSFDQKTLKSKLGNGNGRMSEDEFVRFLQNYRKIYISTGEFFFSSPGHYRFFQPKPYIIHKVNFICNELGKDFIGIHIRRTDNTKAITFSPTSLFISAIQSVLKQNPAAKFFLSTDSPGDEMILKQNFPDNIFSYPKILDRNNEDAIKAALVDMLCLSKAIMIFGSYYSSFSEAASFFSGNKLVILKNL